MIYLGVLKEVNNVRFKLSSDEPLAPATVQLVATDAASFSEEVAMERAEDDSHYEGVWNTQARSLGIATAQASAEDLGGNLATVSGNLELISSWGRHYGQQYGNGM